MIDVDAQIIQGNQGKVIGMTNAEWSHTVNKNYSKWSMEERDKG